MKWKNSEEIDKVEGEGEELKEDIEIWKKEKLKQMKSRKGTLKKNGTKHQEKRKYLENVLYNISNTMWLPILSLMQPDHTYLIMKYSVVTITRSISLY